MHLPILAKLGNTKEHRATDPVLRKLDNCHKSSEKLSVDSPHAREA